MNTSITTATDTTITAGTYRIQQLAKQAGVGMDTLADALSGGVYSVERKPTAKVVLQPMEAQLLNVLTRNLDNVKAISAMQTSALRDQLDAQTERLGVAQNRLDNASARVRQLQRQAAEAQERIHELETRSFWQRLRG